MIVDHTQLTTELFLKLFSKLKVSDDDVYNDDQMMMIQIIMTMLMPIIMTMIMPITMMKSLVQAEF